MWRKLLVAALLAVVAAAIWSYTSATYIIWDGGFELTVRVSSNLGPPRSVNCQAFGDEELAKLVLEKMPQETFPGSESATSDPFTDEPLTVIIPVSGGGR